MSDTPQPIKRKLIEVALPLEAINRESAREKSIRHGHPSTLHLWWARRPLAACRAVLFAQLVDDPSSRPDLYPTEADQAVKRKELFDLIERLVVWENATDEALLREAHAEIAACFDGKPPAILDPFAGGGSIPLEAQRLGLEAHASDLNPVAVLINKALIEIPPRWAGHPPVFPGAAESRLGAWPRATGLAEDVRRYGQWMRDEAERRIGHLYPKATLADGSMATVIAWIWARTVTCPNPACGAVIPLISSLWLSKKKDRPTWLRPIVKGRTVTFDIVVDPSGPPDPPKRGRGARFACYLCAAITSDAYVKAEGRARKMETQLLAIATQGHRKRTYLAATEDHVAAAAAVPRPMDVPDDELPDDPRNIWCVNYGLVTFADLFTNRQLVAMSALSNLVREAQERITVDGETSGMAPLRARSYAHAVATYLAFSVSKVADNCSALCGWMPQPSKEGISHVFGRQALPMLWDFAEGNPAYKGPVDIATASSWVARAVDALPGMTRYSEVAQLDATTRPYSREAILATDPPYYDNISYADLSDFFYVWLRRSLLDVYPDLLGTLLTPKRDELVASPYRNSGSMALADKHFEEGYIKSFASIRDVHRTDAPMTMFYAFKQTESDAQGTASTGWEKMLSALTGAGLLVSATWPMRTERDFGLKSGTNALASSVILACRPRSEDAESTSRRNFIQALKTELPRALHDLQQGSVAPVDLAQAAIGPGMAVFSRYRNVVEPDGSVMTVRTALALINQVLDEVLAEQEGDFDADTRFCVKWFGQFGWNEQPYGRAEELSRSTNTSVGGLVRGGVFWARAGRARLLGPEELSTHWDPAADERISVWEVVLQLAKTLDERGTEDAARLMAAAGQRVDIDAAKELAYLLFSICEKRGWTQTALLLNGLGTSWSDLSSAARTGGAPAVQEELELGDGG